MRSPRQPPPSSGSRVHRLFERHRSHHVDAARLAHEKDARCTTWSHLTRTTNRRSLQEEWQPRPARRQCGLTMQTRIDETRLYNGASMLNNVRRISRQLLPMGPLMFWCSPISLILLPIYTRVLSPREYGRSLCCGIRGCPENISRGEWMRHFSGSITSIRPRSGRHSPEP